MTDLQKILVSVSTLVLLYLLYRKLFNIVSVNRYEYLSVITFEWKPARQIRKEMEEKVRGKIRMLSFYRAMARLQDEKIIEYRTIQCEGYLRYEYRKIIKRNRKFKHRVIKSSPKGSLDPVGA